MVKYNALTTESFIAKAIIVHGDGSYDYSQVDYKKSCTKVKIIRKYALGKVNNEMSIH